MTAPAPVTSGREPLVITLWDFTWYTRTGPGEPFEDLDLACRQARDRGCTAIRICAMPFLLFGSGIDTTRLRLEPLGGVPGTTPEDGPAAGYGQRTRWYDVKQPTVIDARAQLLRLFEAADRHGLQIIVSSWEYQQSPAFAAEPDWYRALHAVAPEDRAVALGQAHADLMDLLIDHHLDHVVAYTEIHNEVQIGYLTDGLGTGRGDAAVPALTDRLTRGIAAFKERHPQRLCTVNYAGVPVGALHAVPQNADVLAVHPYVYGTLGELVQTFGLRDAPGDFLQEAVRPLLRDGAPPFTSWRLPEGERWKNSATIMSTPELYVHDWCDPEAFDRWLYDHWGEHRRAMEATLDLWLDAAADLAAARSIPVVLGEGYVGYTPLEGTFEEGPVGAELCRRAMRRAHELGMWGAVVCSNAAPHHPMWQDVGLQRECAELFTGSAIRRI